MMHPTTHEEMIEFSLCKERMRLHDADMQERAPHAIALDHQKQILQELSQQKITNDHDAMINSRKKHAIQAAIARTENMLKGIS
jgi:hypothetical protein